MAKNNNPLKNIFNAHRKGCIIGGAIALFLIIGGIGAAVSPQQSDVDTNKNMTQTDKKAEEKDPVAEMQSAAEDVCDLAAIESVQNLPGKYDNYIIDAKQTFEPMSGWYDKDGNPIYVLSWNGKNKTLDVIVRFTCVVSGTKDSPKIEVLKLDEQVLRGNSEYPVYYEDGTQVE